MDQKNEGNKVIIIWLSFCKKQTDKQTKQTKEIGICPKVFFADVNTHRFSNKRETVCNLLPLKFCHADMDFFHT